MKGVGIVNMPENVYDFIKAYSKNKHVEHDMAAHMCNVYHIKCENMAGEITDEKFAVNMFTDTALERIARHTLKDTINDYAFICLGTNSGTISPSGDMTDTFKERIGGTNKIDLTGVVLQYDNVNDVTRGFARFMSAVYDYDYQSIDTNVEIFEIGIRGETEALLTHSHIYDITGTQTSFIKHLHEKVTVTIYLGVEMDLNTVINNLWSDGNYSVINPLLFLPITLGIAFDPETSSSWQTSLGDNLEIDLVSKTGKSFSSNPKKTYIPFESNAAGSITTDYDTSLGTATSTIVFNKDTRVQNNGVLYEDARTEISKLRIIMSWDYGSPYNYIYSEIGYDAGLKLSAPESFETYVMSNLYDDTFSDTLFNTPNTYYELLADYRLRLPVNQLNVSSLKLYNHNTGDWESESFVQDASFIYDFPMMTSSNGVGYRVMLNGNSVITKVFANSKAGSYPILSFETNATTVYATDKYWDTSTWESVNYANVQQALQNKKFYITTGGRDVYLRPRYDVTIFALSNTVTPKTIANEFPYRDNTNAYYAPFAISNPKCNCIVGVNQIVYPDDPNDIVRYPIKNYANYVCNSDTQTTGSSNTKTNTYSIFKLTEDGDRLVFAHRVQIYRNGNPGSFRGGCYRIYTISSDKTVEPTFIDVQLGYTTAEYDTPTRHSFTDKGYLVACHNDDEEIRILDVYHPYVLTTTQPDDWATNYTDYYTYDSTTNVYSPCSSDTWVADTIYKFNVVNLTGTWVTALNRTKKCVYRNTVDTTILKFDIYDMENNVVLNSFTIDGTQYLMNGMFGWKDNVYIRLYDQDLQLYVTFNYNIPSGVLTQMNNEPDNTVATNCTNFDPSGYWDNSLMSCDEFFVYPIGGFPGGGAIGNFYSYRVILDKDPTTFRTVLVNGQAGQTLGIISKTVDGSFLALDNEFYKYYGSGDYALPYYSSFNSCTGYAGHYMLLDMGYYCDFDEVQDMAFGNTNISDDDRGIRCKYVSLVYKDYVIWFEGNNMNFYPLRRARVHKIQATTESIQCINNPKRITPQDEIVTTIKRN